MNWLGAPAAPRATSTRLTAGAAVFRIDHRLSGAVHLLKNHDEAVFWPAGYRQVDWLDGRDVVDAACCSGVLVQLKVRDAVHGNHGKMEMGRTAPMRVLEVECAVHVSLGEHLDLFLG
jgi:hypothetical protein